MPNLILFGTVVLLTWVFAAGLAIVLSARWALGTFQLMDQVSREEQPSRPAQEALRHTVSAIRLVSVKVRKTTIGLVQDPAVRSTVLAAK